MDDETYKQMHKQFTHELSEIDSVSIHLIELYIEQLSDASLLENGIESICKVQISADIADIDSVVKTIQYAYNNKTCTLLELKVKSSDLIEECQKSIAISVKVGNMIQQFQISDV